MCLDTWLLMSTVDDVRYEWSIIDVTYLFPDHRTERLRNNSSGHMPRKFLGATGVFERRSSHWGPSWRSQSGGGCNPTEKRPFGEQPILPICCHRMGPHTSSRFIDKGLSSSRRPKIFCLFYFCKSRSSGPKVLASCVPDSFSSPHTPEGTRWRTSVHPMQNDNQWLAHPCQLKEKSHLLFNPTQGGISTMENSLKFSWLSHVNKDLLNCLRYEAISVPVSCWECSSKSLDIRRISRRLRPTAIALSRPLKWLLSFSVLSVYLLENTDLTGWLQSFVSQGSQRFIRGLEEV